MREKARQNLVSGKRGLMDGWVGGCGLTELWAQGYFGKKAPEKTFPELEKLVRTSVFNPMCFFHTMFGIWLLLQTLSVADKERFRYLIDLTCTMLEASLRKSLTLSEYESSQFSGLWLFVQLWKEGFLYERILGPTQPTHF